MSGAAPDISARRIGAERHPVAVIDSFHPDPDALRTWAIGASFEPAHRHYPGIRADLPPDYFATVRAPLIAVLRGVFGGGGGADLLDASLSMVTTPPDRLLPDQRLPHVDALEPGRIALVHYLSPTGGDGTAFFRHRATGFEAIDAARSDTYLAALRAGGEPPPGYPHGDTDLFERIGLVEARYNRAVVYRSAMLHSGAISPGAALSADPVNGRLTVTAFLQAR